MEEWMAKAEERRKKYEKEFAKTEENEKNPGPVTLLRKGSSPVADNPPPTEKETSQKISVFELASLNEQKKSPRRQTTMPPSQDNQQSTVGTPKTKQAHPPEQTHTRTDSKGSIESTTKPNSVSSLAERFNNSNTTNGETKSSFAGMKERRETIQTPIRPSQIRISPQRKRLTEENKTLQSGETGNPPVITETPSTELYSLASSTPVSNESSSLTNAPLSPSTTDTRNLPTRNDRTSAVSPGKERRINSKTLRLGPSLNKVTSKQSKVSKNEKKSLGADESNTVPSPIPSPSESPRDEKKGHLEKQLSQPMPTIKEKKTPISFLKNESSGGSLRSSKSSEDIASDGNEPLPPTQPPPSQSNTSLQVDTDSRPPSKTISILPNRFLHRHTQHINAPVRTAPDPVIEKPSVLTQFYRDLLGDIFMAMNLPTDQAKSIISSVSYHPTSGNALIPPRESQILLKVNRNIDKFLMKQKDIKKVVVIQSLVRRWLAQRKHNLRSMKNRTEGSKRALSFFKELIKGEEDYLQQLIHLSKVFIGPLRTIAQENKSFVKLNEVIAIFWNLEDICGVHQTFLRALYKLRDEKWPSIIGLGDIIAELAEDLKMYESYVNNYKNSFNTLMAKMETSTFRNFIDNASQESEIPLQTMLTIPLNYISKYELVLSNLSNCDLGDDEEEEKLKHAYSIMSATNQLLINTLENSDKFASIMAVQRKIVEFPGPLNLIKNNRVFLFEKAFFGPKGRKRIAYFFNDILIICKTYSNKDQNKFKFMSEYELITITDIETPKTGMLSYELKYEFQITSEAKTGKPLRIICKTLDEKNSLKSKIEELKNERMKMRVFGVSIEIQLKNEGKSPKDVPKVVTALCDYILQNAAQTEGIFRVSGTTDHIKTLKEKLNIGEFQELSKHGSHVLAGALKLYFRELPEPLCTYDLYDSFINLESQVQTLLAHNPDFLSNANSSPKPQHLEISSPATKRKSAIYNTFGRKKMFHNNQYNQAITFLISEVPEANRSLLKYLCHFLYKVSTYSSLNKMGPQNLAIVFAPNLIRPREETISSTLHLPKLNTIVTTMIESCQTIFPT